MARGQPRVEDIAERLMEFVVGLKRRAQSGYDEQMIPYPQHSVLKRLEKVEALTTADLARAELMTPQAMGGLVATLEEAGYVARKNDKEDARRRLVTLTSAGRKLLAANRAARHRWLARLVAEEFDESEQRTLTTALALLGKLIPPRGS